jgi:hypothetical protein
MMIRKLVLLLAVAAIPTGAAASGKAGTGKRQMVVHEQYHADAIRLVCDLIGNKTPEAARNQRRCREGASIGPNRPRGVRPRRSRF